MPPNGTLTRRQKHVQPKCTELQREKHTPKLRNHLIASDTQAMCYTYPVWNFFTMPKNITLAIDEDLLDKARVLAAMRRTSVNEMVREYLKKLVEQEAQFDEVTEELLRLSRGSTARMGDWRPSREDTYSGEPRFDRRR